MLAGNFKMMSKQEKCPECGLSVRVAENGRMYSLETCSGFAGEAHYAASHSCKTIQIATLRKENAKLRAVVDKLLDYHHHNLQASFDEQDGAIDPTFYDDCEDEDKLATNALGEAITLALAAKESR